MCQVSKCCCCIPLRTGSLILAIFGLLGGIWNLYSGIAVATGTAGAAVWFNIIDGIFYLIAYGSLLFGAIKYHQRAMQVNLVFTAIIVVVEVISAILIFASIETYLPEFRNNCAALGGLNQSVFTCDQLKSTAIGTAAATVIVGTLLNIYFWFCNYSFYLELKTGGGNPA